MSGGRVARTVILGAAALAAGLYALQRYLDLDVQELLGYAAVSVLFVAIPFVAALALFGVRVLFRRFFSRR